MLTRRRLDSEEYTCEDSTYRFTMDVTIDDSECDNPKKGLDRETLEELAQQIFGPKAKFVSARKLNPAELQQEQPENDTYEIKRQVALCRDRR